MPTARGNARAERLAGLLPVLLAGAACASQAGAGGPFLSRPESASFARVAEAAVRKQDDLPGDSAPRVTWASAPHRESADGKARFVALALIRFAGITNTYCRLVVSVSGIDSAVLVGVPAVANYDACTGTGPLLRVDVDGDGVPDLVHIARLPSNRYPTTVAETVVYLARSGAPAGYCYSADASRAIPPAEAGTPQRLVNAAATRRKDRTIFSCAAS